MDLRAQPDFLCARVCARARVCRHAEATHFWLNEGWTTYIERLLQSFLHSPAERGFSYLIGSTALYEALNLYKDKPKYQRLVIEFEPGEDPDDAYSSVAYEKGGNFLLYLGARVFLYCFCVWVGWTVFGLQSARWAGWKCSCRTCATTWTRSWASRSRRTSGSPTSSPTSRRMAGRTRSARSKRNADARA